MGGGVTMRKHGPSCAHRVASMKVFISLRKNLCLGIDRPKIMTQSLESC